MGARCRAIKQLDQVCCLTEFRQHLKECFEYPGAAQSPEPLPYAVPVAIFAGECAPCYAVYGEVVDGLEKCTVVMPRLSPRAVQRSILHGRAWVSPKSHILMETVSAELDRGFL